MDENNYLGYYAKDKFGNLFQFEWDANDDLNIIQMSIIKKANKEDYEIVEIKVMTEYDKEVKESKEK